MVSNRVVLIWQFFRRRLIAYLNSSWIPLAVTCSLFMFLALFTIIGKGCTFFPPSIHEILVNILFLLFPVFFFFYLTSVLGISIASIYQLRNKWWKKGITNIILFLMALFLSLGGLGAFLIIALGSPSLCSQSPSNRAYAIETARDWARLDSLPKSARNINTESTGGAFTTQHFTITFEAPKEDIEAWLKDSPGTKDIVPTKLSDGSLKYSISPGGKAAFAELILSADGKTVWLNTYWD